MADPLAPAEDEAFPALTARQIERIARWRASATDRHGGALLIVFALA